jgi:ribose-phosphate pyrophosphokinase
MIRLIFNGEIINVKWHKFSDGAITCKIPPYESKVFTQVIVIDPSLPCSMVAHYINMLGDAMVNMMIAGKITRTHDFRSGINFKYLPYARAERIFEEGNPHPLRSFLTGIQFKFDTVFLTDPHVLNDKVRQLMYEHLLVEGGEISVKSQASCFFDMFIDIQQYDYVIAPDNGAVEKASKIAELLDIPIITATKKRDPSNGRILETNLDTAEDLTDKKVLIADDILDGGGTFIPLALRLRQLGATQVDLYVTHLIASKRLDPFLGVIDNLLYYQIAGKYITAEEVENFNDGYVYAEY